MKYTTSEYLIDSFWFFEPLINMAERVSAYIQMLLRKAKLFVGKIDLELIIFRVVENLPNGVLIIFLGFLVCFSLLKYTEKGYGNRISPIVTTSMSPAIPAGSLIFSRPEKIYENGEIVSFIEKTPEGVETGKVLTHRVIGRNSEGKIITKGDSNTNPDPNLVSDSQVLGKVYKIIPMVGYFDFLLGTLPGFFVFVAIPAILIVKNEIKFIKKFSKD